jgi:hypothetical protein
MGTHGQSVFPAGDLNLELISDISGIIDHSKNKSAKRVTLLSMSLIQANTACLQPSTGTCGLSRYGGPQSDY